MQQNSQINKINKNFSISTFLSNIQYLFKYRIKDIVKLSNTNSYAIEHLKYELQDDFQNTFIPKIKKPFDTIEQLICSNDSICRFGDGEFLLMEGKSIPFQKADERLQQRLIEIFVSDEENILIGAQSHLASSLEDYSLIIKNWIREFYIENKDILEKFFNHNKIYYDSTFTQLNILYKNLDYDYYFSKIREIWENKDITIVCGNNIFKDIESNIFDNAKSIDYLYAPSKNAFSQYNEILEKTLKTDLKSLKIIILGPTATVLAYDLAKNGHRALDLGHIAKSYDWYTKSKEENYSGSEYAKFFLPD